MHLSASPLHTVATLSTHWALFLPPPASCYRYTHTPLPKWTDVGNTCPLRVRYTGWLTTVTSQNLHLHTSTAGVSSLENWSCCFCLFRLLAFKILKIHTNPPWIHSILTKMWHCELTVLCHISNSSSFFPLSPLSSTFVTNTEPGL